MSTKLELPPGTSLEVRASILSILLLADGIPATQEECETLLRADSVLQGLDKVSA